MVGSKWIISDDCFSSGQRLKRENEIQREGIECARSAGCELARTNAGKVKVKGGWMQLAQEGWGDTTGYNNRGLIVMIEFKDVKSFEKPNHSASDEQLKRLNDVKSKGGLCGIACCNEHVTSILRGIYIGL